MAKKLIGTDPNQVPTNGDLGSFAYKDADSYGAILKGGRKNLIVNGDFKISQRGNTWIGSNFAVAPDEDPVTVDHWQNRNYGEIDQTIRFTDDVLLPNNVKTRVMRVTARDGDTAPFYHMINNIELEPHLLGQTITVSYWYRSSTSVYPRYCNNDTCVVVETPLIGDNEWHFAEWSFKASSTWDGIGTGMQIHPAFTKVDGSTLGANGDEYFEFALVQAELGEKATPFEHRSYTEELLLCSRYFVRLLPPNTTALCPTYSQTTNLNRGTVSLPVPMHSYPTITWTGYAYLVGIGNSTGTLKSTAVTYMSGVGDAGNDNTYSNNVAINLGFNSDEGVQGTCYFYGGYVDFDAEIF
jgi:hypothetical protein